MHNSASIGGVQFVYQEHTEINKSEFFIKLIALLWTQNTTGLQLKTATPCFIRTLGDASHGLKRETKNKAMKQMEVSHSS